MIHYFQTVNVCAHICTCRCGGDFCSNGCRKACSPHSIFFTIFTIFENKKWGRPDRTKSGIMFFPTIKYFFFLKRSLSQRPLWVFGEGKRDIPNQIGQHSKICWWRNETYRRRWRWIHFQIWWWTNKFKIRIQFV